MAGFLRSFGKEIIVGVAVAIAVGALAALWPTFQALAFPDYISGNYILLGPAEHSEGGPDVIYVSLKSYDGRVWGAMSQKSHRWSIAGYWKNSYLVFSYRSDGNDPSSIGFGEQFLTSTKAGQKPVLMGDTRGNYCLDGAVDQKPIILRCPSVLVQGEPDSAPEAAKQYATYLGGIQKCQPVDIPMSMKVEKLDLKCPDKH